MPDSAQNPKAAVKTGDATAKAADKTEDATESAAKKTGLHALDDVSDVNFIAIPGASDPSVVGPAAICGPRRQAVRRSRRAGHGLAVGPRAHA